VFLPKEFNDALDLSPALGETWNAPGAPHPKLASLAAFAVLAVILFWVGTRKSPVEEGAAPAAPLGEGPRGPAGDAHPSGGPDDRI